MKMSRSNHNIYMEATPEQAGAPATLEWQNRLLAAIVEQVRVPGSVIEQVAELTDDLDRCLMRPDGPISQYASELLLSGSFGVGTAVRRQNATAPYEVDLTLLIEGNNGHRHASYDLVYTEIAKTLDYYRLTKGETRPIQVTERGIQMRLHNRTEFLVSVEPFFSDDYYKGVRLPAMLRLVHGEAHRLPDRGYLPTMAVIDGPCLTLDGCDDDLFDAGNPKMFIRWFKERVRRSPGAGHSPIESDDSDRLIYAGSPLRDGLLILLSHRDRFFCGWSRYSPLSMSIIRLAAQAYRGQTGPPTPTLVDLIGEMNRSIAPSEPGIVLPLNSADDYSNVRNRTRALFFFHDQYLQPWLVQAEQDVNDMLSSDPEQAKKKAENLFGVDLADFSFV